MSRIRNARDFVLSFRRIAADYQEIFGPRIAEFRKRCTENPSTAALPWTDEVLETHERTYVINRLLASLNWRLDATPEEGLPDFVPVGAGGLVHGPSFVEGAEDSGGHRGAVDRGAGGTALAVSLVGGEQRLAVEVGGFAVGAVNAENAECFGGRAAVEEDGPVVLGEVAEDLPPHAH